MPFLTYDPFPQCLQQSPLTPLLLARVTSEEVGAIYQTLSVSFPGSAVCRRGQKRPRATVTASLQPSGLSSLLAAIRCSLATERASHVAGRSSDRPAKLPGAVRHRRAVSGLSFRGALAGRFLLHGLRPCRRLSSQEASDRP